MKDIHEVLRQKQAKYAQLGKQIEMLQQAAEKLREVAPLLAENDDEDNSVLAEVDEAGQDAMAAKAGASAIPKLAEYLKSPDREVRLEAVKQIGEIGTARSLDPLISATRDSDPDIQIRAADGLVNFYLPGYLKTGFAASIRRVGTDVKGKASVGAYLLAIAVAPFEPLASLAIYALVALVWRLPDQRIEKMLGVNALPCGFDPGSAASMDDLFTSALPAAIPALTIGYGPKVSNR